MNKFKNISVGETQLTGNFPEGFLLDKYLEDLEAEYRTVANDLGADEIEIKINTQNASGYRSEVAAWGETQDGDQVDLSKNFQLACQAFWDRAGSSEDYYESDE